MICFALTGGGCRGALQAGACHALLEAGIIPDFFVGTSAGALNALYLACHGVNLETVQELRQVWTRVRRRNVFSGNPFSVSFNFIRGKDSLYSGRALRQFISRVMPRGVTTFGDLTVPCYITTTDLRTKRLYLFGEDPGTPFLDAVLASSAIPVLHPPIAYQELQLVDGGVLENVPADIAMDKGATTIYLLNVGYGGQRMAPAHGVVNIFNRVMGVMMTQSLFTDLERAQEDTGIALHHLHLNAFPDISLMDFSRSRQMMESGYQAAQAYMRSPVPLSVQRTEEPGFVSTMRVPGAREWPTRAHRYLN